MRSMCTFLKLTDTVAQDSVIPLVYMILPEHMMEELKEMMKLCEEAYRCILMVSSLKLWIL